MDDLIFFKRESKRSYLDKQIPEDLLIQLFEIIRWTPSCSNNQPWRFVFVTDKDRQKKFMTALPRGNQWAAKAPVLVAVCAREKDDHVREDDPVRYSQVDSGMAVMSLLLGATHLGLMGHAMAGYEAKGIKAALDIPDEYHVLCVVAIGYQGPIDLLEGRSREYDESPRTRKEVGEIIFRDTFEG